MGDHLVLLTTLEIATMWGFYIGTIFKKPSVYTEYYTLWLISSYLIATPIGSSLMWIPLDRVCGHFCVFRVTPLCLVVVFAVGNDAVDIYPFPNP